MWRAAFLKQCDVCTFPLISAVSLEERGRTRSFRENHTHSVLKDTAVLWITGQDSFPGDYCQVSV